jgi:hypothetical protein
MTGAYPLLLLHFPVRIPDFLGLIGLVGPSPPAWVL